MPSLQLHYSAHLHGSSGQATLCSNLSCWRLIPWQLYTVLLYAVSRPWALQVQLVNWGWEGQALLHAHLALRLVPWPADLPLPHRPGASAHSNVQVLLRPALAWPQACLQLQAVVCRFVAYVHEQCAHAALSGQVPSALHKRFYRAIVHGWCWRA